MVQGIDIVRGRTVPLELEITDANGNLYTLAEGETILFGIKKNPTDDAPIFVKAAEAKTAPGAYGVTITPEDTLDLVPGGYYYDVGLETGGDYYTIIEPSPITIQANVTAKGDAYA